MSHFLMFTLVLVLGTECLGWKHGLYVSVTEYFNDESPRKNYFEDVQHSKEPRGTLACALSSAELFYDNLKTLIGKCNPGENEFRQMTVNTNVSRKSKKDVDQEPKQNPDELPWRELLSIRDERFTNEYIHFLANVWKMIDEYKTCAMGYPEENRAALFKEFNRWVEKFSTDTIYRCGIPYRFYPGETMKSQNVVDETTKDEEAKKELRVDLERIHKTSEDFYSVTKFPIMLRFIDGYNKIQTVGCVRNAAFMLFSALRSEIPGGCPSANKKINAFINRVLRQSPLKIPAMEISMQNDPVFFNIGMENTISRKASVLQEFEGCLQDEKFTSDVRVRKHISMALSNYDLDVVNCAVDLKYLKPYIPVDPLDFTNFSGQSGLTDSDKGKSTTPEEKFISLEPTTTAIFFEQNPPGTVLCFKKIAILLFDMMDKLIDDIDGCSEEPNSLVDFDSFVETKTDKGDLIHRDGNENLFEKEMKNFNKYGRRVVNGYRSCLKQRNIFENDEKRGHFAGGVMRFQDLYGGCGAYSEKNFWEGPFENAGGSEEE